MPIGTVRGLILHRRADADLPLRIMTVGFVRRPTDPGATLAALGALRDHAAA